jgi:hypothetical protein
LPFPPKNQLSTLRPDGRGFWSLVGGAEGFYHEAYLITEDTLRGVKRKLDAKKNTALLGSAFLVLLGVSYAENLFFFSILGNVLNNVAIAVGMLFLHNVLVVSLILLGMTFYVSLVVHGFFKNDKHADVVISHPRSFALIFSLLVVFLSILRGATLINGGITVELLPLILLISTPIGIVEGYGIYLTIKKTLGRTMNMKGLASIYAVFLVASVMEVAFINGLILFAV